MNSVEFVKAYTIPYFEYKTLMNRLYTADEYKKYFKNDTPVEILNYCKSLEKKGFNKEQIEVKEFNNKNYLILYKDNGYFDYGDYVEDKQVYAISERFYELFLSELIELTYDELKAKNERLNSLLWKIKRKFYVFSSEESAIKNKFIYFTEKIMQEENSLANLKRALNPLVKTKDNPGVMDLIKEKQKKITISIQTLKELNNTFNELVSKEVEILANEKKETFKRRLSIVTREKENAEKEFSNFIERINSLL